jgi:hypothetical protein
MSKFGKGREQDRARFAGGHEHEIRYEASRENVIKTAVKDAIREVGNSRAKIEGELDRKK